MNRRGAAPSASGAVRPVAIWNASAKLITPRLCYKTADPATPATPASCCYRQRAPGGVSEGFR